MLDDTVDAAINLDAARGPQADEHGNISECPTARRAFAASAPIPVPHSTIPQLTAQTAQKGTDQ